MFKGTQSVPDQIAKVYSRVKYLQQSPNDFSKLDCNEQAKSLFCCLMKQSQVDNDFIYGEQLVAKCKPGTRVLSDSEKTILTNYLSTPVPRGQVQFFRRFLYKNILFHGYKGHKSMKRINSIIQIQSGLIIKISELIYFHEFDQRCIIIGKKMERTENEIFNYDDWRTREICNIVIETETIVCCLLDDIQHKCVLIPCYSEGNEDKFYVFPLVNQIERD